jgi:hypothetical protein
VQRIRDPLQERDRARIVAAHRRHELRDAGSPGIRHELLRQRPPDPATLVLVADRERDLCRLSVTHEPRDPDRPRVAVEIAHEDMVVGVDACKGVELLTRQARLGAAKAPRARAGAETLEQRGDGCGVGISKEPDGEAVDVAGLHGVMVNATTSSTLPTSGPSS